jgi:hypothetical protein
LGVKIFARRLTPAIRFNCSSVHQAAQCLDRSIESIKQLAAETAIWKQQRNAVAARVEWMFTTEKARAKMGHAYPRPQELRSH